jgi:FkbM family methyltransferase
MRKELLYNPLLLLERLGRWATERRRLRRLARTPARSLNRYHIDSLELLDLLKGKPPGVVYDIGANCGTWTMLAKSCFPEAEVHAFEPLDGLKAEFERNTAGFRETHWHGIALGAQREKQTMAVNSVADTSSLLELSSAGRTEWNVEKVSETVVEIWPLDRWREQTNAPWPDLIKLDIQGYELECLKGATACLRRGPAVLTEVSFREFYEGQALFSDLVFFLRNHGYELTALGHGTTLGAELVQADALFLPAKRAG